MTNTDRATVIIAAEIVAEHARMLWDGHESNGRWDRRDYPEARRMYDTAKRIARDLRKLGRSK